MRRRTLIAATGAVAVTLAGCLGDDDGPETVTEVYFQALDDEDTTKLEELSQPELDVAVLEVSLSFDEDDGTETAPVLAATDSGDWPFSIPSFCERCRRAERGCPPCPFGADSGVPTSGVRPR